jgi:hypothetical protein
MKGSLVNAIAPSVKEPISAYTSSHGHNLEKKDSRRWMLDTYRRLTGRQSLPVGQLYVTLSGFQDDSTSELAFLLREKWLCSEQFVGIDRNQARQKANQIYNPQCHWPVGAWDIEFARIRSRVGVANLDTVQVIGTAELTAMTIKTMYECPKGTVLFVNAACNNPWARKQPLPKQDSHLLLTEDLSDYEQVRWASTVPCCDYLNHRTLMRVHTFYKEAE